MIKTKRIFAVDDNELTEELNTLGGRIISIDHVYDNWWRIFYEE